MRTVRTVRTVAEDLRGALTERSYFDAEQNKLFGELSELMYGQPDPYAAGRRERVLKVLDALIPLLKGHGQFQKDLEKFRTNFEKISQEREANSAWFTSKIMRWVEQP